MTSLLWVALTVLLFTLPFAINKWTQPKEEDDDDNDGSGNATGDPDGWEE